MRARGHRLGVGQPALAERDRRAAVLGHVEHGTAAPCARRSRARRRPRGAPPRCRTAASGSRTRQFIASVRSSTSPSSLGDVARLGERLEHLLRRVGLARPVAGGRARWPARRDRRARGPSRSPPSRTAAPRVVLAADQQRARRGRRARRRAAATLLAERGGRPLEQLDRHPVGDHRAPARVLVADRGARQQLAARRRSPPPARTPRARRPPARHGAGPCPSSISSSARSRRLVDPELERESQPLGRLVEGQRRGRRARGEHVVGDAARGPGERRGRREVVRELGRAARRRPPPAPRPRAGAAPRGAGRSARRTAPAAPARARSGTRAAPTRAPRSCRCARPRRARRAARARRRPPRAGPRARTPCPPTPRARAGRWSPAAAARAAGRRPRARSPGVPSSASGRTSRSSPSTISTTFVSTSARHSSQTRNALPAVRSLIVPASSATSAVRRRRADESVTSSPESPASRSRTTSSERRRSASVSDSASGTSASRNVASSSSRARPPARARWRSRPSVGPSAQCASSSTSSTGRRGSTPGRAGPRRRCAGDGGRCPGRSRRAAPGPPRSGISRASSPPVGPSAARSSAGSRTRASCSSASTNAPYGRAHDGVARAVEHQRAARGRLGGELAHEPALARAGLAADEHHPRPAPAARRQQRAQRRQLARRARRTGRRRAGKAGREGRRSRSGPIVRSDQRVQVRGRPARRKSVSAGHDAALGAVAIASPA